MERCAICGCNIRSNNRGEKLLDNTVLCDDCTKKVQVKGLGQYFVKDSLINDINLPKNELIEKRRKQAANNYADAMKANKSQVAYGSFTNEDVIDIMFPEPLRVLHGARGRSLYIYEDFLVIDVGVTVGSVVTGNATDGIKVIFYKDIIGIQFKLPGVLIGYLQFETPTMMMNNGKDNFFNENTYTFNAGTKKEVLEVISVYKFVFKKVSAIKQLNVDINNDVGSIVNDIDIDEIQDNIKERSEQCEKEQIYEEAQRRVKYKDYYGAITSFNTIRGYKDSEQLMENIQTKLEKQKNDTEVEEDHEEKTSAKEEETSPFDTTVQEDDMFQFDTIDDAEYISTDLDNDLELHLRSVEEFNAEYDSILQGFRETDNTIAEAKEKIKAINEKIAAKKDEYNSAPLISSARSKFKKELDQLMADRAHNENYIKYLNEDDADELNEHYKETIGPVRRIENNLLNAVGMIKCDDGLYKIEGDVDKWELIGREKNNILFISETCWSNGRFSVDKYEKWIISLIAEFFSDSFIKYVKTPAEVFKGNKEYKDQVTEMFMLSKNEVSRYMPLKDTRVVYREEWYLRDSDDDVVYIVDNQGILRKGENLERKDYPLWRPAFWIDLDALKTDE